jgi:hypothetical protein
MKYSWRLVLAFTALLAALAGCGGDSPPAFGGDGGLDGGGDADGDVDGDADGDTDSDADVPDADGDGLSDDFEDELGTDPDDEDSDGDGASDLVEWMAGTDPLDPDDNPEANGDVWFLMPFDEDPEPQDATLAFDSILQRADLFILMDTSGSMAAPIGVLQTAMTDEIIADTSLLVPDLWFGLGAFEDYPLSPYGADGNNPFELSQRTTDDAEAMQAAADALVAYSGADYPESQVPALWATATGGALGDYVPAQDACETGEIGYPCFRRGALPIIVMVTDNHFHGDYDGNDAYTTLDPPAPTWEEMADALNDIHARVPSVYLNDGETDCNELALATRTVDAELNPVTIAETGGWPTLGTSIVAAVTAVVDEVPYGRVVGVPLDDDSDEVDAVLAFIARVEPDTDGGFEDPDDPGIFCVGGLDTFDDGDDGNPDGFADLPPGTKVCFDVIAMVNETVPADDEPMVYEAFIDVMADEVTLLDSRTIFFLVPPVSAVE